MSQGGSQGGAAGGTNAAGETEAQLLARVRLYAALRWAGVGMATVGVVLAAGVLATVIAGRMPPGRLMLCMLCTALPLGAFGVSNDTAVSAMRDLGRMGRLPEAWRPELAREAERRRDRLRSVQPSPRTALVIPALAALALGWVGLRLTQAWAGGGAL